MFGDLNWPGILYGVGAGLVVGILATVAGNIVGGSTVVLVVAQLLAFLVAGWVAGRFSLVGEILAGGFAGLILYFGLAVVSVIGGNDVAPVAVLFFGVTALVFGTAGAVLSQVRRR